MRFIHARKADFSRIANRAQDEYSADDLRQETWLMMDSFERKLGRSIDFDGPHDQHQVLGWVFNEFVKYSDKIIRSAVRLDMYWEDKEKDSKAFVFENLLADDSADPFKRLQVSETIDEFWGGVLQSYSQLTAYIILLDRVGSSQKDLAKYLGVVVGTLRLRFLAVRIHAGRQPSLFDGLQKIGFDFHPLIASARARHQWVGLIDNQYGLNFRFR